MTLAFTVRRSVWGLAAVVAVWSVTSFGGPPGLSTNPGNHVIFPAKGQTPEQQKVDELAAYDWATAQTSWDPYQAQGAVGAQSVSDTQMAKESRGSAVGGAARGALLGVAIGAVAGDAGKGAAIGATAGGVTGGMSSRRTRGAAKASTAAAVGAYNQKFALWDKCFVAAMEGKGYTVK